ncbi:MAG: methyltransferase domain-containing protein [Acidobacteriota bacterium]|nr:methyltransferase domain-containing protein [Acidobacteriota bacterium]
MAENLIPAWWARLRGKLGARPCPYRFAWALDLPMRAWHASPAKILGAFGLEPGERVLEIGPGTGYYSLPASRLVGAEGALVALDIQLAMLLELRRRNAAADGMPVLVVQASAVEIPILTGSVDHVFLTTVLGEIPDRPRALAEIRRVLRRGGRLSVSEQLPDPDYVALGTLRRELAPLGFVEERSRGWWTYTSTWTVT